MYVSGGTDLANDYARYFDCMLCGPSYQLRNTNQKRSSEPAHQQAEAPKPALRLAPPAADADRTSTQSQGPWKGMQYRLVGPFRGGRVVAVSGVVGQDDVYYFGAVAGGVWKTTDGGLNWKPIFDKTKDASPAIGAIAVSESDPNVIYVGTGRSVHSRQHRWRQRRV